MRIEVKFSLLDTRINGKFVAQFEAEKWVNPAVLASARKVTQNFFETFTSKESALEESDVSFRIQNGMETCYPSCQLARLSQLSDKCNKGCTWKKSLILEIKVQSNDPENNLVIACFIKTFMEDWHTVGGFRFNFTKGIVRVVSDDHDDDAVNKTDTFCGEQNGFLSRLGMRPISDQEGYVKFGNMTLFDRIWAPLNLGGNGGRFLKKDGAEDALVVEEIKRIRETEAMKEADLREAVRIGVVNYIIMLTENMFQVCAQLWQKPENEPEIGGKRKRLNGEWDEAFNDLFYSYGQRTVITATIKTSNSLIYTTNDRPTSKPGPSFLWLRDMNDHRKWEILTNNANLIKDGFFETFKDRRWLSPDMVSFRIYKKKKVDGSISKTVSIDIVIDVPHRTDSTKEAMFISALLAAFVFEHHGLKWNTFRLNSDGNFSLNAVVTNRGKTPTEVEAMTMRNQILTNLGRLRGDVFKYTRDMTNAGC